MGAETIGKDTYEVTLRVTVTAKDVKNHHVTLDCRCSNQKGASVITGSAVVLAMSGLGRLIVPSLVRW